LAKRDINGNILTKSELKVKSDVKITNPKHQIPNNT